MTDEHSFANIEEWFNKLRQSEGVDAEVILLGNKSDLINEIAVSEEKANKLAKKLGVYHATTSAKDGRNLDDAFSKLLTDIINNENLQQKIKRQKETFRIENR